MQKNEIAVKEIYKGSIAEKVGIEKGDVLLKINGSVVNDMIEYRYLACDSKINLLIRKLSGEVRELNFKKDTYEDIGIDITDPVMDNPQRCHNKCIFCFIDQLPKGLRESLYFKDDDSRLSFLQGNFITLTNMDDEDIKRIIKYKISPINVSVHTTSPDLRIKMLNNKNAGNIMERLTELTNGGINLNCQIVLCPGVNDGAELKNTIFDLYKFYPRISNIAVVPVGITKFREKLYPMQGYDEESCRKLIELISPVQQNFQEKIGEPFVRLADEFYLLGNENFPDLEHYGDFEQLEDGIGMIQYFKSTVRESLEDTEFDGGMTEIAFITGELAGNSILETAKEIEKRLNLKIKIYKVKNNFFGEKITVSGLLTGNDVIEQTLGILKEKLTFITGNMLKAGEDIFLDDVSVKDVEKILNTKITRCKYTGDDLVENIINEVIKWQNL